MINQQLIDENLSGAFDEQVREAQELKDDWDAWRRDEYPWWMYHEYENLESLAITMSFTGESKMDMQKYAGTESDWLKAKDIEGKNVKVVIREVGEIHFDAEGDVNSTSYKPAQDKATLKFEGSDKGMVLNVTNTRVLMAAYGPNSDDWVGKEIGLQTKEYKDFGATGIVVVILDQEFEDTIPF